MAKRIYTALVELEAPNENDFVNTPFDTAEDFSVWVSRHLNGSVEATPGRNKVTVYKGERLKVLISVGHTVEVTK